MTIQLRLMGTYFFGKSIMNSCWNEWRNWLGKGTVHEAQMRFCKWHPFDKLRAGSISLGNRCFEAGLSIEDFGEFQLFLKSLGAETSAVLGTWAMLLQCAQVLGHAI